MEELLSAGERKELELFRFVLNSDGFISTTSLSELIGSSVSNVWRIINKLAETYPDDILLVKNKQLGVQFVELDPMQDTYLQIKRDYLKNNLNYILLDSLFNEHYSSAQEFCEAHFISMATFYTKKKELDVLLALNKVTIDTKNFRIRSFNDIYVREFYYHFYWESFKTITWPFKTIEKKTIEVILDPFLENAHITVSNAEKDQILFRLVTTVIRIKNNHIFDCQILHNLISPEVRFLLSTQTSWLRDLVQNEEEYAHENEYLAFLVISNYSSAYVNLPIPDDYLVNYFE
ncbi:helix-turn-helix domain-containing protein, partial [Enterococcus rotai]